VDKTISKISTSKQNFSSASDRQSLSLATTSKVPLTAIENNYMNIENNFEKKETALIEDECLNENHYETLDDITFQFLNNKKKMNL